MSLFSNRKPASGLTGASLKLEREQAGAIHELWLSGRINIESAPELRALLLQRLQLPACRTLTIHFEDVGYIDAAGLAILLELLKESRLLGKQFLLKGLGGRPRYLLEVSHILHLFDSEDDEVLATPTVPAGSP